jgi:rhodanese-related sulfurtransferase
MTNQQTETATQRIETIDAQELKAALDAGSDWVLLDARPAGGFQEAHLPGAVLATSDTIIDDASRLIPDRSTTVVTYCGRLDCRRSTRSAERLSGLGYRVIEFPGGLEEWREAGYPVEVGH